MQVGQNILSATGSSKWETGFLDTQAWVEINGLLTILSICEMILAVTGILIFMLSWVVSRWSVGQSTVLLETWYDGLDTKY